MWYDLIDWWRYHYIPCYGALENCFMNLMGFELLSNIYIPWWKLSTLPEKAFMQNPDLHVHVFRRSKKLTKLHTWNVSFTVWLTHVPWCRIRRQWMGSAMVQIMACRLFEKNQTFSFKKIRFKLSSVKWRPFCPPEDGLIAWDKLPCICRVAVLVVGCWIIGSERCVLGIAIQLHQDRSPGDLETQFDLINRTHKNN